MLGSGHAQSDSDQKSDSCFESENVQGFDALPEKCRAELDTWVGQQTSAGIAMDGDIVVGMEVPATLEFHEVPAYRVYRYGAINDRRVLVDGRTRKIVKIYK